MSHQPPTTNTQPKMNEQLEKLASSTDKTTSCLAAEAIEPYLNTQSWQIKVIVSAVKKANSKNAKLIAHKKITEWLTSWGTENEQVAPK